MGKVDGLTGACDKLGFSELTKNLLLAMADNNRVPYIDAVATSYATLMKTDPRLSEFLLDPSVKKGLKVDGLTGACDKLWSAMPSTQPLLEEWLLPSVTSSST